MKKTFLFAALVMAAVAGFAQNKIAVHNGTAAPRFYFSLDSALTYAQYDDVIYLSGGTFSTNIAVNTKIRLIGVGWHPSLDSTGATNRTVINSSLTIKATANGSSFEGFQLNGHIFLGTSDNIDAISNITIQKCKLGMNTDGSFYFQAPCSFISVIQCLFNGAVTSFSSGDWHRGSLDNSTFLNNYITYKINLSRGQNNYFRHNIFSYSYQFDAQAALQAVNNSSFDYNIFHSAPNSTNSCTFNSNLNVGNPANSTVNTNNIGTNVGYNSIYRNLGSAGVSGLTGFQIDADYRFLSSFLMSYPNAADCGIFGGDLGWKTIPSTPWIYEKTIPTATDASGNLRVTIKAKAQSN